MASKLIYHNVPVPRNETCIYTVRFTIGKERLHIGAHSWTMAQRVIAYAKKRSARLIEVTRTVEVRLSSYVRRTP